MATLAKGARQFVPRWEGKCDRRAGRQCWQKAVRVRADGVTDGPKRKPAEDALREEGMGMALLSRYRNLQEPAKRNTRYSEALAGFVDAAVIAYSLGATAEGVMKELEGIGEGTEEERRKCREMLAVSWLTIQVAPSVRQDCKRWTPSRAVGEEEESKWRGFVELIVDGYFTKGWVWYPLGRLYAERNLNPAAESEPAPVICERMRVVYQSLRQGCGMAIPSV